MDQQKFHISVWERNLARKNEEREKLRQAVLSGLNEALNVLSEKYSWDEIFIFGSVTREGAFHENSDVDIGIEGLDPLQHHEFVGELSMLVERGVDVVLLEECGFGDRIKEKGLKWLMKTE
jgi:uncharacterized protein